MRDPHTHDVPLARLYLLRATYLLVAVGLGLTIWPLLLNVPADVEHFRSVTWALLGAVGVLAALGVRHPLRMLPVLLFELLWKSTWLVAVGLPRWRADALAGEFQETWVANLMGVVIVPLVIPWGYVVREFLRAPGERWTRTDTPSQLGTRATSTMPSI